MLCRGPQSDPAVETRARRRGRVRGDSHLGRCLAPGSREQGEGRGEGLPQLPPLPSPVLELGTLTLLSAAPPGQSLTCATSTPDKSRMKAEATSVPDSPPLKAKTRALESSLSPPQLGLQSQPSKGTEITQTALGTRGLPSPGAAV